MRGLPIVSMLLTLMLAPKLRAETATRAATAVERAEQLFRQGTAAFEAQRYSDAYGSLRAAWDLAPTYKNAAGLGQLELYLAQYRDAAEHLAYCLRHFPPGGDPAAREHVEEGLARAREHAAALRLRVDPEGAEITIDGAAVGRSPLDGLIFVEPGSHVVQASAPGRRAESTAADAQIRVARDVVLSLTLASADAAPPPAASPGTPGPPLARDTGETVPLAPAASTSGLSDTAWTLVIGGSLTAVAGGAALIFRLQGSGAADRVSDAQREIAAAGDCSAPAGSLAASCSRLRDAAAERNRDNERATVTAVSAGVLGVATVITALVLESRTEARASASRRPSVGFHTVPGGGLVLVGGAL